MFQKQKTRYVHVFEKYKKHFKHIFVRGFAKGFKNRQKHFLHVFEKGQNIFETFVFVAFLQKVKKQFF